MKRANTCDKCKAEDLATLYDFKDGKLICLKCVPEDQKGSVSFKVLRVVIAAAVTGLVNIEKRRRTISKRT